MDTLETYQVVVSYPQYETKVIELVGDESVVVRSCSDIGGEVLLKRGDGFEELHFDTIDTSPTYL